MLCTNTTTAAMPIIAHPNVEAAITQAFSAVLTPFHERNFLEAINRGWVRAIQFSASCPAARKDLEYTELSSDTFSCPRADNMWYGFYEAQLSGAVSRSQQ